MLTVRLGKSLAPTLPILRRANAAARDFRRLLIHPERRLERVHAVVRGLHGWTFGTGDLGIGPFG